MSGCLSRGYISHEGGITEVSMSRVGQEGQQLDKTCGRHLFSPPADQATKKFSMSPCHYLALLATLVL
jgi:hypothetical protein